MSEHLKHTPVPWHGSRSRRVPRDTIMARDEQQIAVIGEQSIKEGTPTGNRQFMLRACNNHQKLLNLVDRFVGAIDDEGEHVEHLADECDVCDAVDDARRLLDNLKGN